MTVQGRASAGVCITYGTDPGGLAWARQNSADWLYLGKQVKPREVVRVALGTEGQKHLGTRLHRIAADLRDPFLLFVSRLGDLQKNSVRWWSTSFSWKNWGASDLFLLICYSRLAEEVVSEAAGTGIPLLVQIEDPWLFQQLRRNLSEKSDVRFGLSPSLLMEKAKAVVYGISRRIGWLPAVCIRHWRQRRVWPKTGETASGASAVGVYSFPMERCIRPNREWHDPFLPGMDAFLRDQGHEVFRFSPPEAEGFERELAERSSYFRPLIRYATLSFMIRSSMVFWRPVWPRTMAVDGSAIDLLAIRECWGDVARTALCANELYYRCLDAMLRKDPCAWLVYPYENQPWEKLTGMASRKAGLRTIGIQPAAWSKFYMSLFPGPNDEERMPLPDLVLTAGEYSQRLLEDGGMPPERLKMCGSFRYDHLANNNPDSPIDRLPPASREEVLVVLPIDNPMSDHLLSAIRNSERGTDGIHFHIKAHPSRRVNVDQIGFQALAAPNDINEAFKRCGTVLFVGSTVGPEAVGLGRTVLRYRPELLLDVDPSEAYGETIQSCDDSNLREKLIELIESEDSPHPEPTASTFAPLNRELLREVFV